MEILIAHWEIMEKLILETPVLSHVTIIMNWDSVPVEHAEMMAPGVVMQLLVVEV